MARVAVIGAGWAGLAASVRACLLGHGVTLMEMAHEPGGRARSARRGELEIDNGQHILIGAYTRTLALMRTVGVDPERVLARLPLALTMPDGSGLSLPSGHRAVAFARGVLRNRRWPLSARIGVLRHAIAWQLAGFRCPPATTVAELTRGLLQGVRDELIEPLSVAALNTPSAHASAAALLRVLRDGIFGGRGSADLLLPRRPLTELLPAPAVQWLADRGASVRLGARVHRIERAGARWRVDGEVFDDVVVAASATEAARLAGPIDSRWAERAAELRHEPIVTVVLASRGARLAAPMVALPQGPAQFAFDHGAIGGPPDRFAFVVSGAARWLERGREAVQAAVLDQARTRFPAGTWPTPPEVLATTVEWRATFACTPSLLRPGPCIGPRLVAAGDYVEGPYPATLEGAVRSGFEAAERCGR